MIEISAFFKDDEKNVQTNLYRDFGVVKLHDGDTTFKFFINSLSKNTRQAREFATQILNACDVFDGVTPNDVDEDLTAATD